VKRKFGTVYWIVALLTYVASTLQIEGVSNA